MPPEPPKKDDPLTILARARLRQQRRRFPVIGMVTLAVIVGMLGLIAWLTWPAPDPGELWLTVYDGLGNPDEEVALRAQLGPQKELARNAKLDGFDLWFLQPETGLREQTATDVAGLAGVPWRASVGKGPFREVLVRYPGDGRRRGLEATGRVFVWPRESSLLVIDADHALALTSRSSGGSTDRVLLPGVADALRKAKGAHRIVYLTAEESSPVAYYHLATWLKQSGPTGEPQVPSGPLLNRAAYPADDPAGFYRLALEDLKKRFEGKLTGIAGRAEEEGSFQQAGITVLRTGSRERKAASPGRPCLRGCRRAGTRDSIFLPVFTGIGRKTCYNTRGSSTSTDGELRQDRFTFHAFPGFSRSVSR